MADNIEKFGFTIKTKFDFSGAKQQLNNFISETNKSLKSIASANIRIRPRTTTSSRSQHVPGINQNRQETNGEVALIVALNNLTRTTKRSQQNFKMNAIATERAKKEKKSGSVLGGIKKFIAGGLATRLAYQALSDPLKMGSNLSKIATTLVGNNILLGGLVKDTRANSIGISGKSLNFLEKATTVGGDSILNSLSTDRLANSTSGIASIKAKLSEFQKTAMLVGSGRDLALFEKSAEPGMAGLPRQRAIYNALSQYQKRHQNDPYLKQKEANIESIYHELPSFNNALDNPKAMKFFSNQLKPGNIQSKSEAQKAFNKQLSAAAYTANASLGTNEAAGELSKGFDYVSAAAEKVSDKFNKVSDSLDHFLGLGSRFSVGNMVN